MLAVKDGSIKEGEVTARGYGCDVSNEENVKAVVKRIERDIGIVDTLVTSAGTYLLFLTLTSNIHLDRYCGKLSCHRVSFKSWNV